MLSVHAVGKLISGELLGHQETKIQARACSGFAPRRNIPTDLRCHIDVQNGELRTANDAPSPPGGVRGRAPCWATFDFEVRSPLSQ